MTSARQIFPASWWIFDYEGATLRSNRCILPIPKRITLRISLGYSSLSPILFTAWRESRERKMADLTFPNCRVISPVGKNCDSDLASSNFEDQENWSRNYRSHVTSTRRSARHSCGSRPAEVASLPRTKRRGEISPLSSQSPGGGSGDGIKERWSGLHSGDTSETTSLLAGFSRATSSGCCKKRVQKRSVCIGHRCCRRVDK